MGGTTGPDEKPQQERLLVISSSGHPFPPGARFCSFPGGFGRIGP